MNEKITERIKTMILDRANMDDMKGTDDYELIQDLGYDSLRFIDLIIDLESAFEITFDDGMLLMEELSSVNKIIETVRKLLAGAGEAHE